MTEAEAREASRLAAAAAGIVTRLDGLEQALRSRTRIILVVGVLIALVGLYMVVSQQQGNAQRRDIVRTLQEVRDCTTPDLPSPCQRRLAESGAQGRVVKGLEDSDVRAAVAVELCRQAAGPDLLECAMTMAEQLRPKPTRP